MRSALIIDDDAIHVMSTETLLEPLGFGLIDAVPNGRAAANYFKHNLHPDIVFLDLNMPEFDGVEFMNYLIETNNTGPHHHRQRRPPKRPSGCLPLGHCQRFECRWNCRKAADACKACIGLRSRLNAARNAEPD